MGRIWIGMVLIAAITTMPEMVTGVSSVAFVSSPDLALGTLLGSCCFNLCILAVLDVLHGRAPVLSEANPRHIASAGYGVLLIAVAAGGMLLGRSGAVVSFGWVGIGSVALFVLYMIGMRRMFLVERSQQWPAQGVSSAHYAEIPKRRVYFRFSISAAAVICAGIWLAFVGDDIGETTGWNASFVGSLFLAITTSAPELVVAMAALRLGAIDLAVADVLGANMLDVAVIALVDLFYREGPVLSSASSSHLITAAAAAGMYLLVIVGLKAPGRRKAFGIVSWYALPLVGLYILAAYALFT